MPPRPRRRTWKAELRMEEPGELTFAFVDLAGFTALTEAHGDTDAAALIERFEQLTRDSLTDGGRLVKTIGDAVMLVFTTPDAALDGVARLVQACVAEPGCPLPRAGLHQGTAVERGGDYIGGSVNLAARVAGQAHGGQVVATHSVAEAARRHDIRVVDLGAFELRNLSAPVELFELELCPLVAGSVVDPVCRMQWQRAEAIGRLRHHDHDYWFCSLDCAARFATDPDRYTT